MCEVGGKMIETGLGGGNDRRYEELEITVQDKMEEGIKTTGRQQVLMVLSKCRQKMMTML